MLKNVTLSAEENLTQSARKKAMLQHTTLNSQFRQWLSQYTASGLKAKDYDSLMDSLSYAGTKRHFTRDELNER